MRVKILKDLVGLYNLCYEPGEIVNLPDSQARELIETKHAEETKEPLPDHSNTPNMVELTDGEGKKFKVETAESRIKRENQSRR